MNAQKRKSRPFEGMIRKAVVIVPSDEDYKARIEAQEKANSKEVPDNGVMEMKGDYWTESDLFSLKLVNKQLTHWKVKKKQKTSENLLKKLKLFLNDHLLRCNNRT